MGKIIIAIDPGAVGGIVISGPDFFSCVPMPETETDVVEVIRSAYKLSKTTNSEIVCIIEKVGGFAGGDGQPGSAMFNFGYNFGGIIYTLIAFKIRTELVTPQKWQKGLSLGNKEHVRVPTGISKEERKKYVAMNTRYKTEWKNKLKSEAQRLYPNVKVTLKISDALLILEYYKRYLNK